MLDTSDWMRYLIQLRCLVATINLSPCRRCSTVIVDWVRLRSAIANVEPYKMVTEAIHNCKTVDLTVRNSNLGALKKIAFLTTYTLSFGAVSSKCHRNRSISHPN